MDRVLAGMAVLGGAGLVVVGLTARDTRRILLLAGGSTLIAGGALFATTALQRRRLQRASRTLAAAGDCAAPA